MSGASRTPCVLLVEDEIALAQMVEDALVGAGYDVACATRVTDALELIEARPIQAAVLDINIGRDLVFPVAALLQQHQVPFVFASSWGKDVLPAAYSDRPVLQKPYKVSQIPSLVTTMLREHID